jgi:glycosyltransferase involved in cell wall biosynthesis
MSTSEILMNGQRTNVAMFLPFFFPAYGGTELATYNLARELQAQRLCNVTIWSLCKKNKSYNAEFASNDSFGLGQMDDVPILRYPAINLPKVKDLSIKLIADLNNSDEHILHFQGAHRVLSRLLLEKTVKNKITVLTTHGLHESATIVNHNSLRFFINPFFVESLKSLDHIIALSRTDLNLLVFLGIEKEKITVITNGIDETKFEKRRDFANKNSKLKILSVARFDVNKNYVALIQIVGKLAKIFNLEVYLVGALADREYFDKIVRLIKELDLEKIIRIGISLDNPALVDCYLSCDLFVLLSTMETSPIAILEAMYAGLPVVVTNVGGVPEIVANGVNGFLVSPNGIQKTYDYMVKLLNDANLRKEIGLRNKKKARNYTWAKVAFATNQLYNKLLENHVR